MFMWRDLDQEGEVLDVLVQKRRNKHAALKLLRKLMRKQGYAPAEIVINGLRSYAAALEVLGYHSTPSPQSIARQQSGRKFAPLSATARAKDSAPQILVLSPALRCRSRRHLQSLQCPASPDFTINPAHFPSQRHGRMDRCIRRQRVTFRLRILYD